ncbi:hypothetical protein BLOT_004472 [Blomia tropicalis]|nr:hypothetical protein BLOT_004472 [Blomia tropicalis]
MNSNNQSTEQCRSLSDDIICCDDSSQSDDFKLSTSSNLDEFTTTTANVVPGRRGLVHSVSIIVEPAIVDGDCDSELQLPPPMAHSERRRTIAGPIVLLEDFYFDQPKKAKEYDDIVQSLFASARVRKEEFARLLEEHAQIVSEINKAETERL